LLFYSDVLRMSVELEPFNVVFLDKVQLRFLGPNDIDVLKVLCREWFPIEYPNGWFKEVTSGQRFYSLAVTLSNEIIGVLVAQIKERRRCNKEDSSILGYWYPSNVRVAYVLILGVKKQFRRTGVGSLLLDNFLSHLKTDENQLCKAVYLHVLPTNTAAISFYEKRHFRFHNTLWNYYNINNVKMDGHCYVMYINGGEPPWDVLSFCKKTARCVCGNKFVSIPFQFIVKLWTIPCCFLQGYSR